VPREFDQLLDATIEHLQELKENGVRYVDMNPANLQVLTEARRGSFAEGNKAKEGGRIGMPSSPQPSPPRGGEGEDATHRIISSFPSVKPSDAKVQAMAQLRERAMECVKCPHLASSRKNVVFGVGNIDAELMFVGEAPGADEDAAGEPFVGKAGQLLTKIIQATGLRRDQVYIANILKCRPDTPGQRMGNRKPTPEEMQTCIPYLHAQIDLIQPKVLVALGATAVEGLLGKTEGITRLRGHWKTYRGIPLMPTYHPAYLLRNQAPSEKRRVWEDMLQVMEKLGMPISQRQKNFFL
jgi:uracil-DNA glycosylase family 4